MSAETMTERRDRLHQELAEAYGAPADNWRGGRIYRLADESAYVDRAIAESRPRDPHAKDLWTGLHAPLCDRCIDYRSRAWRAVARSLAGREVKAVDSQSH